MKQAGHISNTRSLPLNDLRLIRRIAKAAGLSAVLVVCWNAAEVRPGVIFEPGSLAALLAFIRGLFPPDISQDFLRVVILATGQTLAIALAGTSLSILAAIPLGVLATQTLWSRGVLLAGEKTNARGFLLASISGVTRALLGFLRAVPDLMWALLFVVAVGLGSLAGTLALAVSYCGLLGRVYADVFEEVDSGPLEALHATGATRLQVLLRAIWPQAEPSIVAYSLYSFESCVRAASVLGFIGAGGIGYEIALSMRMFEYGQVLTLLVALIVVVAITDTMSQFLRRRLHANAPPGSLAHKHIENKRSFRVRLTPFDGTGKGIVRIAAFAIIAWSFYATGFFNWSLLDSAFEGRVARFAGSMLPPDLDPLFVRTLGLPILQTIGISVIGTFIGLAIGVVFSLPATATLVLAEREAAGRQSWLERTARRVIYYSARLLLNILRSIPELVWVLVCIIAVGLGPFAGTLAIGLHAGGVLGKLYAETLEEVPARLIETLKATGARPLQILLWGIWPQARPTLISYTVLRWEMSLRASTILGLVGGGGLGLAIYNNLQLGFYNRTATLIIIIYALVLMTEWTGNRLRNRRTSV